MTIYLNQITPDYIEDVTDYSFCVVAPSDCAITDEDILRGRLAPIKKGNFDDAKTDSVHPLYMRGVDFTDVGKIMSEIDSRELRESESIEQKRSELSQSEKTETPTEV